LNTYAYTGLPLFSKDKGGEAFRNVFKGYKPLPYIGFGLDYSFNLHFSIGPTIRFLYNSKSNYKIPNTTIGLEAKYNFLPNDKKISPFVVAEFNSSYMSISQNAFSEITNLELVQNSEEVKAVQVLKEYKEKSVKLNNVSGICMGIGSDFMVKQKYGMFVSINYMATSAHNQAKLKEIYPDNESKYSYFLIKFGLKFGFLRSNSL
jgi:outer membrane protein W